jgi:hypothetical protein
LTKGKSRLYSPFKVKAIFAFQDTDHTLSINIVVAVAHSPHPGWLTSAIIDVTGIIAIDLVTLAIALLVLLVVFIPEPENKVRDEKSGAFFRELAYGFRYVLDRPSLLSLQIVFFFGNLFSSVGFTLFAPMILASTAGDSTVLGGVQSAGAVGGLVGGLALTAWGGPKKKIDGVLLGWILFGAFGLSIFGLSRTVPIWLGASFLGMLVNPMLNGSNQAIWQAKVSPEVQGRVFSVRRLIAQVTAPISMAVAGPLADNVFEPAMKNPDHWLGELLGPIFGNDPGSGMSLLVFLSGLLVVSVGLIAYRVRQVREVEAIVPDHDQG